VGQRDVTQTSQNANQRTATSAREFWLVGPQTWKVLRPEAGSHGIGREETNLVVIDHPSISRRHLALHVGEAVFIEDLGSRNGTLVQGVPLAPGTRKPLQPGDAVALGDFQLVYCRPTLEVRPDAKIPAELILTGAMREVFAFAGTVAQSEISALIVGESGVGKDVVAEQIHRDSPRSGRPFVRLNCASFSEALLESELFGHEKGAFTGAAATRIGHLESAHGGTLFLDEVGELAPAAQARLLHVLERREVTRLGSTTPRAIDVRFLSATHRDLLAEVRKGTFRRDLFYRLAGVTLAVAPLRERVEEILPLARSFGQRFALAAGRSEPEFSPAAIAALREHRWPGNVRELRNVMERAVLMTQGTVEPVHLQLEAASAPAPSANELSAAEILERDAIARALEAHAGNQTQAAKALGIARSTLVTKLSLFRMARPRRRS
jgi:two-component system response regulator AtoC